MALEESHDWSWAASGCEDMSFFVFLLYNFNASVKMVSKVVEDVAVGGLWDMLNGLGIRRGDIVTSTKGEGK